METVNVVWSFSSLKTFKQCPKKYYHTKIAKDVVEPDSPATLYGKAMHAAAEDFVRDGVPIPAQFSQFEPLLRTLVDIPGVKLCEEKLGLTRELKACEFDAPDVWWRGIADLVVLDETRKLAYSFDYKTSKSSRYADLQQLDLVSAAIFAKYPQIDKIKSALLFVVIDEVVRKIHHRSMFDEYLKDPARDVQRIEAAILNGVWNPKEGPLCRYCSVSTCEYNRS